MGMTREEFNSIIPGLLKREGGYVNDPNDTGGETNFGISANNNPGVNIAGLNANSASDIYFNKYAQQVPSGLSPQARAIYMDAVVHGGAKKSFADGNYDPSTMLANRRQYLNNLSDNPKYAKYKTGWGNRINSLENELMLGGVNPEGVEIQPNPMKQQELQAAYNRGIQPQQRRGSASPMQGFRDFRANPLSYESLAKYAGYTG